MRRSTIFLGTKKYVSLPHACPSKKGYLLLDPGPLSGVMCFPIDACKKEMDEALPTIVFCQISGVEV